MTTRRRNPPPIGDQARIARALRERRLAIALMLGFETLCALAGVAAFLSVAAGELGWAALLALSSATSYLAADLAERA